MNAGVGLVMRRPLRIEYAGALYHIANRGNKRKEILLGDADRETRSLF